MKKKPFQEIVTKHFQNAHKVVERKEKLTKVAAEDMPAPYRDEFDKGFWRGARSALKQVLEDLKTAR